MYVWCRDTCVPPDRCVCSSREGEVSSTHMGHTPHTFATVSLKSKSQKVAELSPDEVCLLKLRGEPVLVHTWVIHFTLTSRDYTQISEIVRGITHTDKHTRTHRLHHRLHIASNQVTYFTINVSWTTDSENWSSIATCIMKMYGRGDLLASFISFSEVVSVSEASLHHVSQDAPSAP